MAHVATAPAVAPALASAASRMTLRRVLPWAILALGLLTRLVRYLADRSIWGDEAMLSLNILGRSYLGLTEPLDMNQGAPLGFLFVQKAVSDLLGPSTLALRLIPFLASAAAMVLFFLLARRLLAGLPLLTALLLFACTEPSVYYASEIKQYSLDAALALLLLLLTVRIAPPAVQADAIPIRGMDTLAITGAAAIWFSHAATFVLAGMGVYLLLTALRREPPNRRRAVMAAVGLGLFWTISFAAHYFISLRNLAANHYLLDFWAGAFPPLPTSAEAVKWYPKTVALVVGDILKTPIPAYMYAAHINPWIVKAVEYLLFGTGGALLLLGVLHLWTASRRTLALLLLPLAFLFLAGILHRYPMRDRLVLFIHPLLILIMAFGIARLRELYPRRRVVAATVAGLVGLPVLFGGMHNTLFPIGRDEFRPLLAHVVAHQDQADVIYLLGNTHYPTQYYTRYFPQQYALRDKIILSNWELWDRRNAGRNELTELRKRTIAPRVWVLFASTWSPWYVQQEARVKADFSAAGRLIDERHAPGASAYLYDLSLPPAAAD